MTRSLPLLFLLSIAAEISSIIWVGGRIGALPTLLLMFLAGVLGVRLIKSAGTSVAAALRSPVQAAAPLQGVGGKAAAQTLSGVLFLLPGFFSDFLAILLFLAPVQHWIASKVRVDTSARASRQADPRFDRIIEGEAIEIKAEIGPHDARR